VIRDVHDDSIELYVSVFGQDSSEEDPPVAELWIAPYVVAYEEELNNSGVEPSRLRAIFSEEVWNLIVGLSVPVQWLCKDGDLMTLSLTPGEDNGVRPLPVYQ
jgi:hypothetical protein